MAKHSVLSPSASSRWMKCPGSTTLIETCTLPLEQRESAAALQGTLAHETFATALALANPLSVKYRDYVEERYLPAALEYVMRLRELHPEAELYREIRVQPAKFVGTRHASGTADIILPVEGGPLYVGDLKFGTYPVEVENNTQLLLYALGAFAKFYDYDFTEVILVILQPRAYHPDGPIREWCIPIKELRRWGRKLKRAAKRALDDTVVTLVPDPEDQCKYCPVAGICRALAEYELSKAKVSFDVVREEELELPDVTVLTPAELGALLDHAKTMEKWIESLRHAAKAFIENGGKIPYWGTKPRNNREWSIPEKRIVALYGDNAYDMKLRSPAQLEKVAKVKIDEEYTTLRYQYDILVKTDDSDSTPTFGEIDNGEI